MSVSGDVINFSYEAGSSYGYTSYNSYTTFTFSIDKMNGDFYNENGYIRNEQVHEMDTYISIDSPQYLKTISWRSGKLEFISSGGRKDIPAMRKLDEIKVYTQTGEYLKSIKFTYSNRNNRLWLEQVREQANGLYLPICQLVYNYELPARNSNAFDFWGYYNGTSSESKIPSGNYWGAIIDGVSREPSLQYTLEGILTKIRYSTGGITEFEYELNEGCKKNDPQKYKCGGLRIKAIKRISTDTLVTRYHYSSDIFSKIWSSGEIFSGFNFNIRYKDINSTDDNNGNRRNYEASCFTKTGFDLFDVNGAPVLYNSVIVEEPTGLCMQYKYTSLHDSLTADVPSTLHMINGFFSRTVENNGLFFKNSSRFWKRGLLKECRVFPKNGGVSKITAYEYVLDQNVKKVVKGFEQRTMNAMQNNPERTLCVYEWVSQPVYLKRVVENGSPANVGSETEMTYDTTTLLPQIIKVKNMATGTVYKTKTKYPQDFGREINNVVEGDTVAYALKGLDSHHVLMCPIEKVYYRDNVIVGAEIYEYRWHTFANRTEGPVLYRTKSLPLKSPVEFYSSYCYNSLTKKMVCDARLEIVDSFEDYDVYGNVMMKKENFGNNISIIYGYNYSLPVAVVENANARKEVYYTSFEFENSGTILSDKAKSGRKVCNSMLSIPLDNKKTGEYLVTYWESTNGGNTWKKYSEVFNLSGCTTVYTVRGSASRYIDELRILPRDARISTMAYIPGVGIVSETDHNGNTVYYEYDAFGRLIRVLDNDRKIVKQYEYKMN